MRRSAIWLLVILPLAIFVAPLMADAPPSAQVPRVGYLSDESSALGVASFEPIAKALRALGYLEGRNILFENRYAEGQAERLPGLAAALVHLKVDIIVAVGTSATQAAKNATDTIPIVFTRIGDPVALGVVASLARPRGNLTGVTIMTTDLEAKRLEMLTEAIPGVRRVGVFLDPTFPTTALELGEIERAAHALHVELQPVEVRAAEECEAAVRAVVSQGAQALIMVPSVLFTRQQDRLAALAVQHRLPTMWYRRENVEVGGLMSYGTDYADMYRRVATYIDKILKGAKPADLPVEQPMKFELVINLKTAQALGITMPPSLLLLADEVIR